MSTRSGKRIHGSIHENAVDDVTEIKSERKVRAKRQKENINQIATEKKRRHYVRYPSQEDIAAASASSVDKLPRSTRKSQRNTLKEQNTAIDPELGNNDRKTRRSLRTRKTDAVDCSENIEPSNDKTEALTTDESSTKPVKLIKKKSNKKKNNRKLESSVVEDIAQNNNGKNSTSDMSMESYHSAAGSPAKDLNENQGKNQKMPDTSSKSTRKEYDTILESHNELQSMPLKATRSKMHCVKNTNIQEIEVNISNSKDAKQKSNLTNDKILTTSTNDENINNSSKVDINEPISHTLDIDNRTPKKQSPDLLNNTLGTNNSLKISNKKRRSKMNSTDDKIENTYTFKTGNVNNIKSPDEKHTTNEKSANTNSTYDKINVTVTNLNSTIENESENSQDVPSFDANNSNNKKKNLAYDKLNVITATNLNTTFDKQISSNSSNDSLQDILTTEKSIKDSNKKERKAIVDSLYSMILDELHEKLAKNSRDISEFALDRFLSPLDESPDDKSSHDKSSDDKSSHDKSSDDKSSDDKSSHDKSSDDKSSDDKSSDFKSSDDKSSHDKSSDDISSDDKSSDDKSSDFKSSDDKSSDDKSSDDKSSDDKSSDDKSSDDKSPDDKSQSSDTSGGSSLLTTDTTYATSEMSKNNSLISITSDESLVENLVNTTAVLIESSMDESKMNISSNESTKSSTIDAETTNTGYQVGPIDTKIVTLQETDTEINSSKTPLICEGNISEGKASKTLKREGTFTKDKGSTPIDTESFTESKASNTPKREGTYTELKTARTPLKREGTYTELNPTTTPSKNDQAGSKNESIAPSKHNTIITNKHATPPLRREGTFTKEESDLPESPEFNVIKTPDRRKSLPSPGRTPFPISKSASKEVPEEKSILNKTRSIEKPVKRLSSVVLRPRATRVMFCSPIDTPAVGGKLKGKVIKSNLKGSEKSFVFDESVSERVRPARKRSRTQSEADDIGGKRKRLTEGQQQSVERLSRPRTASASGKLQDLGTSSKKASASSKSKELTPSKSKSEGKVLRTRLPNFAALHQKRFAKMESLDECQERKAKRARQLLTPTGSVSLLERVSPKDKEIQPPAPSSVTEESQSKKVDTPKKSAAPSEHPQRYTRFGFKLNLDVNPFSIPAKTETKPKEDKTKIVRPQKHQATPARPSLTGATTARKQIAKQTILREKSVTEKRDIKRKENRTVIRGVRTNRRFELQMKLRNVK